jgi:Spy/CpxP family protein refolding chaperone
MKKRIFTSLALATLSASFLFGQGSTTAPTPPTAAQIVSNRVARLTTLLNLTTAQQTEATTIFTNEQTAVSSLRTSLQTAQTALQTAIKNNDSTGITAQATQIGNLTTQQVEAQAKAGAAFYAILTADQQTKYDQLQSTGFGGPGFGGPGGFRGPGPGSFGGPR